MTAFKKNRYKRSKIIQGLNRRKETGKQMRILFEVDFAVCVWRSLTKRPSSSFSFLRFEKVLFLNKREKDTKTAKK
ncbi:MAG: hypothetical protein C6W58_02615 [Bacillaceae bacterium]|nr:MAG: hypothetical protein C6W58_02615 [Bacillaceae bacterium]